MTLLPDVSDSVVAFVRITYGVLLLGTLVGMLPHARRFFMSERWGGYARSSRAVDLLHNPVAMPIALTLWMSSAVLLVVGVWTVAAAFVALACARYYCVFMRWRGVLRGMGAPGAMTYWLAVAVFVLELTTHHVPELRRPALLGLQVDLALIFLAAALAKVRSGYLRGEGMELGLANPQWGYWWRWYAGLPPRHPLFRLLDHLAWTTELIAALAMLLPPTRYLGGLILIGTFALIATQIRLALLCPMVMAAGLLFLAPDTAGGHLLETLMPAPTAATAVASSPDLVAAGVAAVVAYVALLPLTYGGLIYNFYRARRLPAPWQALLDRYAGLLGISLWRVFSADIVDFVIDVSARPRAGGPRRPVTDRRYAFGGRSTHVCEMIALTSVFTTLKYYPSRPALFIERLTRYARTVPCSEAEVLVFEYQSIRKGERRFEFVPIREYVVDPRTGEVEERALEPGLSPRKVSEWSPIHEGARPGSYAPPA